jgi:hypothetical protein
MSNASPFGIMSLLIWTVFDRLGWNGEVTNSSARHAFTTTEILGFESTRLSQAVESLSLFFEGARKSPPNGAIRPTRRDLGISDCSRISGFRPLVSEGKFRRVSFSPRQSECSAGFDPHTGTGSDQAPPTFQLRNPSFPIRAPAGAASCPHLRRQLRSVNRLLRGYAHVRGGTKLVG